MQAINLWCPNILKFQYKFETEKIMEIFNRVKTHWSVSSDSSLVESGDAISTTRVGIYDYELQPHIMEEFSDFNMWISDKIDIAWQTFNFLPMGREVTRSWFNLHNKTGQTKEHFHNRTDLVVASYIKCEEGTGNIEFRDPLEYHKVGFPYSVEVDLWKELEVRTNDVLIFPGWIYHRTQPNTIDSERLVMTYNINGNPTL